MKEVSKIKSFFLQLLALIVVIFVAAGFVHFLYGYTNTDMQNNSIVGLDYLGERIYGDETVSPTQKQIVKDFMDSMDDSLKNKFAEQNWLIILADSVPTTLTSNAIVFENPNYDHTYYRVLGGTTIPTAKIIFLNTQITDIDLFKSNLVHEFGHCVDYFIGFPSLSKETTLFYQKYSLNEALFNEYEASNVSEFFASAYKSYILQPEITKEEAPDLYEYFEENKNSIKLKNEITLNNFIGFWRLVLYNLKGLTNGLKQ